MTTDVERTRETNDQPPRRVIGLAYEQGHGVPQVVLKAAGASAEELLWKVRRGAGTPIVEDAALLDRLYRLPVDGDIPRDLFELVAIVLVHLAAIDAEIRNETTDTQWRQR
jgi:type III secretion system FlhB-like substrate exporter